MTAIDWLRDKARPLCEDTFTVPEDDPDLPGATIRAVTYHFLGRVPDRMIHALRRGPKNLRRDIEVHEEIRINRRAGTVEFWRTHYTPVRGA